MKIKLKLKAKINQNYKIKSIQENKVNSNKVVSKLQDLYNKIF